MQMVCISSVLWNREAKYNSSAACWRYIPRNTHFMEYTSSGSFLQLFLGSHVSHWHLKNQVFNTVTWQTFIQFQIHHYGSHCPPILKTCFKKLKLIHSKHMTCFNSAQILMVHSSMLHLLQEATSSITPSASKLIESFVQKLILGERWTNSFSVKFNAFLYSKLCYSINSMFKYFKNIK